jgi:hypothetical protein
MEPPTWLQSQFDKLLMTFLILVFCCLALLVGGKLEDFSKQAAGGCLGSLVTLVTTRRRDKEAGEDKS